MQINLTPELDRLVGDKVASGLYENPSVVVREAGRGFEQLEAGDAHELTREEFLSHMREWHAR